MGGPAIPLVSLALLAYLIFQFNSQTYAIGVAFAIVGELIYWADNQRKKKSV